MIAGGALNIALWPIYTTMHGPGSVDQGGEFLGIGTLFWGSMMEGPSGMLIALGLAGSYGRLTASGRRMARVGYVLTMIGVVIPGTDQPCDPRGDAAAAGAHLRGRPDPDRPRQSRQRLADEIQSARSVGAGDRPALVIPVAAGDKAVCA